MVKSLFQLHSLVAQDMGDLLDVDPSRDILTMLRRSKEEGDSFFTITLPTFEDGLLRSLEMGYLDPSSFPSFRFRGGLPLFLKGFLGRIFLPNGVLSSDPDAEAIRAVRQVCSLSKKIERAVSPSRLHAAQAAYVRTDQELSGIYSSLPYENDLRAEFIYVKNQLYRDILCRLDRKVNRFELVGRHGPGAVAEKLSAEDKWEFPTWLESLDGVFPSSLYTHHNGMRAPLPVVPWDDEPPVKVVFVPKTMKTPRVIAIEPYARQFAQQSVSRFLYRELRQLTPNLDLHDQSRNQLLARQASRDQKSATLDLSEASDRVSTLLVEWLSDGHSETLSALAAARSPRAQLPNGDIVTLRKYASMGSALTFPLQSMIFMVICCMGVARARGRRFTRHMMREVSIYGDDIIVPADSYRFVTELLVTFGLKVNSRKSYVQGNFRESCGGEYFDGHDVSIVRLRRDLPTSRSDIQALAATSSFRNECYLRGMWRTARMLDDLLSRHVSWKPAPAFHPSISRWTWLNVDADRLSPTLQRDEIRRPVLKAISRDYFVDGEPGLYKWFLTTLHNQTVDGNLPSERPVAFAIYNRWLDMNSRVEESL